MAMNAAAPEGTPPWLPQLPVIFENRQSAPPCLGEALRRGTLLSTIKLKQPNDSIMNPISDQILANPFTKNSGSRSQNKIAIARAPKNFQSTPHPPLENFQSTLGIIKRTITTENKKFCSMYRHFVA
jgi:hypothetical protein